MLFVRLCVFAQNCIKSRLSGTRFAPRFFKIRGNIHPHPVRAAETNFGHFPVWDAKTGTIRRDDARFTTNIGTVRPSFGQPDLPTTARTSRSALPSPC
jgi:hypothetical protein